MMTSRRATSLEALAKLHAKLFPKESLQQGLQLTLRPTDIVITPFSKCGTTWVQQIVHCLRTDGDMDFDDISRVIPWIETSCGLGLDLNAEQKTKPRAFKSHLDYQLIPKGGKYINVIRDPSDALYSLYKFFEGWFIEPGTISLEDFALKRYVEAGGYWRHLKSWWPHRHDTNVLFLCYEHMKTDFKGSIIKIAEFIQVELNDELLATALEHASLPFMQKHKVKFDDAILRAFSEQQCHLPPGSDSAKVREGQVGQHKGKLSDLIIMALTDKWHKELLSVTGFADYQSLRESL